MPVIIDSPRETPAEVEARKERKEEEERKEERGKGVDPSERGADLPTVAEETSPNPGAAAAAFFTKLQSSVASNPNLSSLSTQLSTLQHQLSDNLSHLPTSLQSNLTTLQSNIAHLDSKSAEQYLHKGEHWLSDLSSEVQRLAKEAVRVVPPGEAEMREERTRKREERLRKAEEGQVGRTGVALGRLRGDRAGLLVDPASEGEGAEGWGKFVAAVQEAGGMAGEEWADKVVKELEEGGEAFGKMMAELGAEGKVGGEGQVWMRYFFRKGEIEEEERRRRRVLDGEFCCSLFSLPCLGSAR